MLRSPVATLLCLLALLTACGPSAAEKEQVLKVVRMRAEALNARNVAQYMTVISPAYNDKGKDFARLRDSLETGFKVYDAVFYQADEQNVEFEGKKAKVNGTFRLKVVIRGKEMVLDGKEHLTLAKEAGVWKIIAGL